MEDQTPRSASQREVMERGEVVDMDHMKARGKRVDFRGAYPAVSRRSTMSCPPGQFIVRGLETGNPYWFLLPRNHIIHVGLQGTLARWPGTETVQFVPDKDAP